MNAITSHVLDTSLGRPARGVSVTLEYHDDAAGWQVVGGGATDADGRLKDWLPPDFQLQPGDYSLTFDTGEYFRQRNIESFYPAVTILFAVRDAAEHYHVPLLLSPFGYSTYRGS
jgi:5-hydroxyisourate hydrolase